MVLEVIISHWEAVDINADASENIIAFLSGWISEVSFVGIFIGEGIHSEGLGDGVNCR